MLLGVVLTCAADAQRKALDPTAASAKPHRMRLILKDGSYQMVMSYQIKGKIVRYVSAERGGAIEEIPLSLVDLDATNKYEARHNASSAEDANAAPILDPELAREESERAALTPDLAAAAGLAADQTLVLPQQGSVLALDYFRGTPELVPLNQQQSDLNEKTGHSILRSTINPMASSHQLVQLHGERADVQMHVAKPELFLRLDDDADVPSGSGVMTVQTNGHDASAKKQKPGEPSHYVIVRADIRQGARVIASFNTGMRGATKRQQDVIETEQTTLPGGHWAKIVPREPLLFGEYCLMEVLSERELNLGVWDFGVHPTEPENRDVLKPEEKRRVTLERRRRNADRQ